MTFPVCLPQGQFAFPRSYVPGIYVRHDGLPPTLVDNLLTFVVAGSPDALVRVWFDEKFLPWSSNRWTLDHIIVDASYQYPTSDQIRPLPSNLTYQEVPGVSVPCLTFDTWYSALWSFVLFEPPAGEYWLSPPIIAPTGAPPPFVI